jgi:hypothetical protein
MKKSLEQERLNNIRDYISYHKNLVEEKQNELNKLVDKVQAISETLKLYGSKAFVFRHRICCILAHKEATSVEFYQPSGNGDYWVAHPYFISVHGEKVYALQSVIINDLNNDPDACDTVPIPENMSWKNVAKQYGYNDSVIKVIANALKDKANSRLDDLKESFNFLGEEMDDIKSYLEELDQ